MQYPRPTPRDNFKASYAQTFRAIEYCVSANLIMPALVLIYSTIDTLAWAASDKRIKNTRSRFEDWVAKWLLPQGPLACSPSDLYGARCAVLHTLTFESDLSRARKVRDVMYAWGNANVSDMQASIQRMGAADKSVGVHVSELFNCLRAGATRMLSEADKDAELGARLKKAAEMHYEWMETSTVSDYLRTPPRDSRG